MGCYRFPCCQKRCVSLHCSGWAGCSVLGVCTQGGALSQVGSVLGVWGCCCCVRAERCLVLCKHRGEKKLLKRQSENVLSSCTSCKEKAPHSLRGGRSVEFLHQRDRILSTSHDSSKGSKQLVVKAVLCSQIQPERACMFCVRAAWLRSALGLCLSAGS